MHIPKITLVPTMQLRLILLIVVFASVTAAAQTTVTLKDAIQTAVVNYPSIKAKKLTCGPQGNW